MHILVCDDDAAFAAQMDEYISEWFRAREIQVQSTVCTSGEQLLATPELERYQLAFLDVDLKTTDGIALGRKLRQVAPDIVLVVLNILLMLTDNNKRATMATMGMTVGLTVAVMVHLCIVAMFNDQVMQRRSLHFQAELEQQRASALLDSYTAQRRLPHEFTNHISALRALLAQGDVGGAQDYIAGVDKAVAASTTIMDTHNPLLDSILTRKYEEATRQGVSVYFDLCDLRDFPLSGVDMVTVLANLLDNAICAAAQAYPPEVYVRVRKTEVEYLLSVRNRVQRDVELPPDGQLPRTTRKEPGHGMGLSNVRDVLLRHGAEYTLSCRDNWFRFTCAVPTGNS